MADAQELLEKIDKRVKYRVVAQLDFDRLQNGKKSVKDDIWYAKHLQHNSC
jgi:hypothetical protein